jgi:hypothetical protein
MKIVPISVVFENRLALDSTNDDMVQCTGGI